MKFSIDPWDVEYGASLGIDSEATTNQLVAVEIEMPEASWAPVPLVPGASAARRVLFVDGVRRIDARVWIEGDDGDIFPGLCASFAAGAVCCDESASLVAAHVDRGVFSTAPNAADIVTSLTTYPARMAASSDADGLMIAVHERMTRTEISIAEDARRDAAIELIVVDGPLRGRQHIERTIGFVKSHAVSYLPGDLHRMVGALAPGERTPVFTIGTSYSRHSWYLRLPGAAGSPWAGIVRCECSSDLTPAEAVDLATRSSASLPRFASEPHKDPRAPQNLYPIGGLERELRRRLGDPAVLYRALRRAGAAVSAGAAGG